MWKIIIIGFCIISILLSGCTKELETWKCDRIDCGNTKFEGVKFTTEGNGMTYWRLRGCVAENCERIE